MNKVLVAGILGLMLTACGQKKKLPLRLRPRPQTLLPLSRKPLAKRLLPSRRLLPKLPLLSRRLPLTWPPRLKLP